MSLLLCFLICKNLIQSAGAISLNYEDHIVSVVAEDLKVPFFGTAFHINYDPKNFIYDHFSLGDYFNASDDPLVLVNSTNTGINTPKGVIVVGISLKRGQLLSKTEGTLLKLYFKSINNPSTPQFTQTSESSFTFSNAVFSTFDTNKNERQDIQNITFKP